MKTAWDNGWRAQIIPACNKPQLLSMAFLILIMLFSRWGVRFVCSLHFPLLLLASLLWGVLPVPWVWRAYQCHIAHPCWLPGWAMTHGDPVKGLWDSPNRSWSQVLLLLWIKSSKNITTKLSRVIFLWHTCKGARRETEVIQGQLQRQNIPASCLTLFPSRYHNH